MCVSAGFDGPSEAFDIKEVNEYLDSNKEHKKLIKKLKEQIYDLLHQVKCWTVMADSLACAAKW